MAVKIQKAFYKVFGLIILSEIPLLEAASSGETEDKADVLIEVADLSNLWNELAHLRKPYIGTKDLLMFDLPGAAKFCVMNGNKIIVAPVEGADENLIRVFVFGTCMGALLMQRKILPLHGSAVVIGGKAYAFIGESGAGKSSLATAFLNEGYEFLSDDVVAVTLSQNNVPIVTPSYPQQKLWEESLRDFGMDKENYSPIALRETKYSVPVSYKFHTEPLFLGGLFELVKAQSGGIELRKIDGLQCIGKMFYHTYRNFLIEDFGLMKWHFDMSASIADKVDFFELRRPISGFTPPQIASLILENIS